MIKGFSYGPLRFEAESAKITIGKLKCEPSADPMKTMVAKQQIAINSLIDRVYKLENIGKGMFFSLFCTVNFGFSKVKRSIVSAETI